MRIISKTAPVRNAIRQDATLEDAFLLYFGEKAGEDYDDEIRIKKVFSQENQ